MSEFTDKAKQYLNEHLKVFRFSNTRNAEEGKKAEVRPVLLKERLLFQVSFYKGTQVFHKNYEKEELLPVMEEWLCSLFKQAEAENDEKRLIVLVGKRGSRMIKEKILSKKENLCLAQKPVLSHNRTKQYLLKEGEAVPFLVDLGVMTEQGRVVHARYDKFRQINRFLEFIEDILPKLPKDREVTILDFGCGKSYLTFAMYHYLKVLLGYDIRVIGLDLKADVIEKCNRLKDKYGYDKLQFLKGDIAEYEGVNRVDMVVSLHACNTATDYALAKAVKWNAKVILAVPLCHHELKKQMKSDVLSPVFSYGIIKERTAALFTDALRAEILAQHGYQTQLLEFIDMEHTPKNILIRAVYTGKQKADEDYQRCRDFLQAKPLLEELLG